MSGLGCGHAIKDQAGRLAYLLAMRFKVERLVAGQAQQLQVGVVVEQKGGQIHIQISAQLACAL